jgi:hypothetical protein
MTYSNTVEIVEWYKNIESEIIKIFSIIPPTEANYKTVIPNLASLILDSGSLIDTIYSELNRNTNKKIFNYYEDEHLFSKINSVFLEKPLRLLSPFKYCFSENKEYKEPVWWSAYNGIKHSRLNNINYCNVENCINIICALHQIIAQEKEFFKALAVNDYIKTTYNIEYVISRTDYVYAKERSNKTKELIIETNLFYSELGESSNKTQVSDYATEMLRDTKIRIRKICERESGNLF